MYTPPEEGIQYLNCSLTLSTSNLTQAKTYSKDNFIFLDFEELGLTQ